MCYAKPGPRCSAHAKASLTSSMNKAKAAIESGNKTEIKKALVDFEEKFVEFATTEEGQQTIENRLQHSIGLVVDTGEVGKDPSHHRYASILAQGNQVQQARLSSYKNHGPEIPVKIDDPNSPAFEKNARKDLQYMSSVVNSYTTKEKENFAKEDNERWLKKASGRTSNVSQKLLNLVPTEQRGRAFKAWSLDVDNVRISDSYSDPYQPRWKNRAANRIDNYEKLSPEVKKEFGSYYKQWMNDVTKHESQSAWLQKPSRVKPPTTNEKIKNLLSKIGSKTPNKLTEF